MNIFRCDKCGKDTKINPPTRAVLEPMLDEKGAPMKDAKGAPLFKQKTTKVRSQNAITGDVEMMDVPLFEDLFPRTFIVRLTVGLEVVQKDFCRECLGQTVLGEAKQLFDSLAGIKSQ